MRLIVQPFVSWGKLCLLDFFSFLRTKGRINKPVKVDYWKWLWSWWWKRIFLPVWIADSLTQNIAGSLPPQQIHLRSLNSHSTLAPSPPEQHSTKWVQPAEVSTADIAFQNRHWICCFTTTALRKFCCGYFKVVIYYRAGYGEAVFQAL